jgi:transcriptional regulator with XRE-family HTH domain
METLGYLLKVTRIRNGLDQREFSEKLGISQATYSRYEKGKSEPPFNLIQDLVKDYDFPVYLILYPDLIEFVRTLPLKFFSLKLAENYFDYMPLRSKTSKRKHEDILDGYIQILALIGQVKFTYNNYKVSVFDKLLENTGYDVSKIRPKVEALVKTYNLE